MATKPAFLQGLSLAKVSRLQPRVRCNPRQDRPQLPEVTRYQSSLRRRVA